jgi:hypothetical protein
MGSAPGRSSCNPAHFRARVCFTLPPQIAVFRCFVSGIVSGSVAGRILVRYLVDDALDYDDLDVDVAGYVG